jgi:hypothetical protein
MILITDYNRNHSHDRVKCIVWQPTQLLNPNSALELMQIKFYMEMKLRKREKLVVLSMGDGAAWRGHESERTG